jgi:RNA polymerase sigma-70 factor (ECF subfamily)
MAPPADEKLKVIPFRGKEWTLPALVAGLRGRDPEAAAAFYDKYESRINGLVWRLMGADDEHDDLVQQVLAQVLSSVGKLRDPDLLEPWLVRLTINTVFKEFRKRRSRRIMRLTPDYSHLPSSELHPEKQQLAVRVYAVLEKMGARERIVFALRYIQGYSLAECAHASGCSLATVKRRLAKAKRQFETFAERDPVLASWTEGVE